MSASRSLKTPFQSGPSKWEIMLYWSRLGDDRVGFLDWGEPRCFACHTQYRGIEQYDHLRPFSREEEHNHCVAVWEETPLQRCHLVARQFGGPAQVENLVLLCPECHDLAPDTPDASAMLDWIEKQDIGKRRLAELRLLWESSGLDWGSGQEAVLFWWNSYLPQSPFNKWLESTHAVGSHVLQTEKLATEHRAFAVIKPSSVLVAWQKYVGQGGQILCVWQTH